jgi:hypothetical protein
MRNLCISKTTLLVIANLVTIAATFSQDRYYIPKGPITIMNESKNQLRTTIGYGEGFFIGLSYSITERISLSAEGFLQKEGRTIEGFAMASSRRLEIDDKMLQVGISWAGQIHFFNSDKFEVIFGATYSDVDRLSYILPETTSLREFTRADYTGIFAQWNMAWNNKRLEYIFCTRISASYFDEVNHTKSYLLHSSNTWADNSITNTWTNYMILTADPVFGIGYSLTKSLQCNLQCGLSLPLYQKIFVGDYFGFPWISTHKNMALLYKIGVQYKLDFGEK